MGGREMSFDPPKGRGRARLLTGKGDPNGLFRGAPTALLAKTHLLGEARAGRGVIRRDHRVVRCQTPLFAVLLGCHFVLCAQMPLQGLELLSVFQAHDVFRRHRAPRRNQTSARCRRTSRGSRP